MMGKCIFNRRWLNEPRYMKWIKEFKGDKHMALCCWCNKLINLGKMGEHALNSHTASKKHKTLEQQSDTMPLSAFGLMTKTSRSKEEIPSCSTSNKLESSDVSVSNEVPVDKEADFIVPDPPPNLAEQTLPKLKKVSTMNKFVSKNDTLRSEIIWTIQTVVSHNSFKSNENVSKLFISMFPDSDIASKFSCGERKSAYLAIFGISEYFKQKLFQTIHDHYTVLFDESLNKNSQSKQMDIHVRYWDDNINQVSTRYLGSEFMGHATANDMVTHFTNGVIDSPLNMNNILQISMDGPNVNWKFFNLISLKLKDDYNTSLINIGSCGLHVLHNSFKTGAVATGWQIDSLLSSLYHLFKDSPARIEDYTKVSGSSKMPLKFCNHRWLENEPVCKRTLEIWQNVVKYVTAAEKKNVPLPGNNSFKIIKQCTTDKLIEAKIEFFKMVASVLQPFLAFYQTDKPVIPFLASDLSVLLKSLLRKFVKQTVLEACNTTEKLAKIDIEDRDNYLGYKQIELGIMTDDAVKRAKQAGVSEKQVMEFSIECRQFLVELAKKVLLKCPISYSLVRNLSSLNPVEMVSNPTLCRSRFKKVIALLKSAHKVGEDCDEIVENYGQFIDKISDIGSDRFQKFHKKEDRLDEFFTLHMNNDTFKKLFSVVKMLLVLSHGQATVERGFSVNKELECVNMSEKSLVSKRIICDEVKSKGGVLNILITNELLMCAASARNKYEIYLSEEKQRKKTDQELKKRKSTLEEIEELKCKKKRLKHDIDDLVDQADKLAEKAEATGKIGFITQSNCMRKRSKEKEKELMQLQKSIDDQVESLKN